MTPAPLSHLKVLDLSRVLAGPWAGQLLGDYGADVIKVERPGTGDDTRIWGPPWTPDAQGNPTTDAAYFLCTNRNKRSITIDFTRPEGQDLVRRLAQQSDVLIENFKVGGLAQYGLDWDSLHALNPRLIYCSVTGFGQTGPYAPRAGYDFLIQGMGGLMSVTGRADTEPGAGPQKVGVALTDVMTGLYATSAILVALGHRDRTGEGQRIDLALLDVGIATLINQTTNYLVGNQVPRRMGNAHPNVVPYQDFPTKDGDMIIACGNDGQFKKLAHAMNHQEWSADPQFATNQARIANRAALLDAMVPVCSTRTTAEWVAALETVGVPCGPINTLEDVFNDPQVQSRGTRITMPHASGAEVALVANPVKLSATPPTYRLPPPLLGADTDAILTEHGMDATAIAKLRNAGLV